MRVTLRFVEKERQALKRLTKSYRKAMEIYWQLRRKDNKECTQRDVKTAGDPSDDGVDPWEVANFPHLVRTFLVACEDVTAYGYFDADVNDEAAKCLLETRFPHISCELIDAINEMEDVETQADNHMEERDLVVEKIKEYLEILQPLRSAGGRAVKKRIEQCIRDSENQEFPLGWCELCANHKLECSCGSTPRPCNICGENYETADHPCDCRAAYGSSEENSDNGGAAYGSSEEISHNGDGRMSVDDDGADEDGGFISEEY